MNETLVLGAVAYDPKVVTIWDGLPDVVRRAGSSRSTTCCSPTTNARSSSTSPVAFDVAWNSPLAWLEARHVADAAGREARAIAMRDTDRDLTSVIVVRADSPVRDARRPQGPHGRRRRRSTRRRRR